MLVRKMTRQSMLAGLVLTLVGIYPAPSLGLPSVSEVRKAMIASACWSGGADFKGCRADQATGGPFRNTPMQIGGEIAAGKRIFTIVSYRSQSHPERDADARGAPECGVSILERRKGKLAYLGHYDMPCMGVRVTGNRVVFDKPPAKWDDTNFFVLDEKGPPPAIYIFGGYYSFYG
jgi:hypothetical protein